MNENLQIINELLSEKAQQLGKLADNLSKDSSLEEVKLECIKIGKQIQLLSKFRSLYVNY